MSRFLREQSLSLVFFVAVMGPLPRLADFWQTTLQDWQSEFLAVGTMVVFAVYLRQRGSPESKPVGGAHHATGMPE